VKLSTRYRFQHTVCINIKYKDVEAAKNDTNLKVSMQLNTDIEIVNKDTNIKFKNCDQDVITADTKTRSLSLAVYSGFVLCALLLISCLAYLIVYLASLPTVCNEVCIARSF
jgi:hypothetical protein